MGGVTVRDVDVSLPSPFPMREDRFALVGLDWVGVMDWMVIPAELGDSRDRGPSNLRLQYVVEWD